MKSFGDKAAGLFEKKKKDAGELAAEKAANAKKLAEDQLKKTQDAITGAASGVTGFAGGVADDAKDGAKNVQKKAGKIHTSFTFLLHLQ